MKQPHRRTWPGGGVAAAILVVVLAFVAAACGDDGAADDADDPTTTTSTVPDDTDDDDDEPADATTSSTPPVEIAVPEVTGPVTAGNGPELPQPAAPAPEGYVEEEFFIGGTATSYETVGDAGADGRWETRPAGTADFRTRILVRRPPTDAFSGVVVVEWLNVSAVEAGPDWAYLAEEIGRSGHAYVAASTQALGVIGGEALLDVDIDEEAAEELGAEGEVTEGGLVNADPERYGSLAHPGDAFAFDIYSQIGAAIIGRSDLVLGGLEPTTLLAAGESQSAGFLTSYLNGVHPTAGVYEGFLVHSRGGGAVPISGALADSDDEEEAAASFVQDAVTIRDDLDAPVMIVEAETDLTLLGYHVARQPNTELLRTWEVAGTSHSDAHVIRAIVGGPRDGGIGSLLGCEAPINTGPHHEVLAAAFHHLVGWVLGGPPPSTADRLELIDGDPVAIARDELGMAIGGVRNPLVDVPVAVVTGDPPAAVSADRTQGFDLCALFGQTIPLDRATLLDLHGSADDYVAAFEASAATAVEAGFLLPHDAEQLIAEAEANRALFD